MSGAGGLTPAELAVRTGTRERHVREWLNNQAAGGYLDYHPDSGTYELPAEHALVLADESSPVHLAAGLEQMAAVWADEQRLETALQSPYSALEPSSAIYLSPLRSWRARTGAAAPLRRWRGHFRRD